MEQETEPSGRKHRRLRAPITKPNASLQAMLDTAHEQGTCVHASTPRERSLLQRYCRLGILNRVSRGLYDDDSWLRKDPHERSKTIARTLCQLQDGIVLTGVTALDFQGVGHSRKLHGGAIFIVDDTRENGVVRASGLVHRLPMKHVEPVQCQGMHMTPPAVSTVASLIGHRFVYVLSALDSALRAGITMDELRGAAATLQCLDATLEWMLGCANASSENGGESFVRAVIISMGFRAPELQVEFRADGRVVRVDFFWQLPDGHIIVLELDGQEKYVNPTMTRGRSAAQVAVLQHDRDEFLRDHGVHAIIHITFEEAVRQVPLRDKLIRAGVPWVGIPAALAGPVRRA